MIGERLIFRANVWRSRADNKVWIEPALSVVVAFFLCSLAWVLDRLIHPAHEPTIAVEDVERILDIISTSMLTVTTFALGTVVTALALASTTQTPRAAELLIEDRSGRASIATFIGSFVFAVTAQTALAFEIYRPIGQLVLLIITLMVLAYMVARLVLFIRTMTRLGQMNDTVDRLTQATRDSLHTYRCHPYPEPPATLGVTGSGSGKFERVRFHQTGYVTQIDVDNLSEIADRIGGILHVQVRPGTFVTPDRDAVTIQLPPGQTSTIADRVRDEIQDSFVTSAHRSFDYDPRFGFIALSEVAQRALSPAVNDPGTAISVACAVTTIILNPEQDRPPTRRDRSLAPTVNLFDVNNVTVVPLDEGEFVRDAFAPICRDAAGNAAVLTRVLKLLAALAVNTDGNISRAAREEAAVLVERAAYGLQLPRDREEIEAVYGELFGTTPTSPVSS